MSIKSTYELTRQTALEIILSRLHSVSNEALADMLESFEESYFRNYIVYDSAHWQNDEEHEKENDDNRIINSLYDFEHK